MLTFLADRTVTQHDRLLASPCHPSTVYTPSELCILYNAVGSLSVCGRIDFVGTVMFLAGNFPFTSSDTFTVRCRLATKHTEKTSISTGVASTIQVCKLPVCVQLQVRLHVLWFDSKHLYLLHKIAKKTLNLTKFDRTGTLYRNCRKVIRLAYKSHHRPIGLLLQACRFTTLWCLEAKIGLITHDCSDTTASLIIQCFLCSSHLVILSLVAT